ncbi:phosphonate transport system ATP-binding protein [Alkalispirochaeta americana]|uniref:Phosphonate transport system ATP-binding protein n=1 Tax=Alkalispirochaeta americana TaxID=159291 RepID=A0A1N6N9Q5_9SPIO|nr:phosphonate ABC transporter ATP-binding protein [Alkalispirochaeta americana]SIP88762.1 phosphonate transport system ATP-binding protein [Alkalispirochaeta americana]
MSSTPILSVSDLKKTFPDGTRALKGVSIDVMPGEFLVMIGSSGAGKSTFLRCTNHLFKPTSGKIVFEGKDISAVKGRALRDARKHLGMIFQGYNLVKRLTTLENVLLGRLGYMSSITGALGIYSREDRLRAVDLLERVGLGEQRFKRADQLSGGQQQRVGIARAIAQQARLILADEPIASLDPKASDTVMSYLHQVSREEGIACIVNLHQVDYAKKYADRIVGLKDGEIAFLGSPEDVTDEVIKNLYGEKGDKIDD